MMIIHYSTIHLTNHGVQICLMDLPLFKSNWVSHAMQPYNIKILRNRPRSIYQYSSMGLRLSGQICKFLMFLLSLNSQERLGYKENNTKYRNLTWKPRSHVRILIQMYNERGLFHFQHFVDIILGDTYSILYTAMITNCSFTQTIQSKHRIEFSKPVFHWP